MKKVKKILLIGGIGLLVLILVAVIVVGLSLGKIVKEGVNRIGPKITQTTLTVDAVDVSLLAGSARVKDLIVGNPGGYNAPNAISVGLAAVSVSPMSVLSDKIVVKSIRVDSPEITFEGSLSGNNLSKIMDNVNGVAKNGGPESTNTTATASGKPGKKIEVDDILITGAKVHGTLVLFGGKELTLASLPLPDIHLANLGTGPEGITAADLTQVVLSQVTVETGKAVVKAAANVGKGVENLGKQGVNTITSGLGGLLKK